MFYSAKMIERAKANAQEYAWADEIQRGIIESAQSWMKFSDEHLWDLMFGSTITRSWMVWSNGYCPACKNLVPMYTWGIDAFKMPWKVRCPHCKEIFPKNDFHNFYRSGLDEHSVFDPKLADRSLLFNVEHPDKNDPLYKFGVDDGEGYLEGGNRWRFIGAYLIYGQWKQLICGGICNLAAAYVVTGNTSYAHKAGVLLDRVADLYPTFDFAKEGLAYEQSHGSGYVSTWHDACEETRELALAYDQIFEALRDDEELVAFLSRKAEQFKLNNPKASFEDIQRNIDDRILRDAIQNRYKIESNYPRTDVAIAVIKTILDWPENRDEVYAMLDTIIEKATAVDGMTGEKGLAAYSTIGPLSTAELLGQFTRLEPNFLRDIFQRHPRLHQMYRFHIDTWCLRQYYPLVGDTGGFSRKIDRYSGVRFSKNPGLAPSMYTFLWKLYELTGDVAFVQILYRANDNTTDGLPFDIFADAPAKFQREVGEVIDREGSDFQVGSLNKQQWHLAVLRSGQGMDKRALWLHYDSGGRHSHADGMNLGLFAKGLDLMPDFGYPPVQYGGWGSPRAVWYRMTASHNTVVVDGQNQCTGAGKTTLWADGKQFRAVRVSGPNLIEGREFERTVAMIDISEGDAYIVDIFRVVSGADHAKFMSSHFGQVTTEGLSLKPDGDYGHGTQMRNFYGDAEPKSGWSVDWKIEDRYHLLPPGSDIHLRYTDLTYNAEAFTCEAWVSLGGTEEAWIPRIMVRRQNQTEGEPLASTFVSIIEPYEGISNIAKIRRLPLETPDDVKYPESNVALEIQLANEHHELFVAADVENPLGLSPSRTEDRVIVQKEWGLRFDGELCVVRRDADGKVRRIALCRGNSVSIGDVDLKLKQDIDFLEVNINNGVISVVSGNPEDISKF